MKIFNTNALPFIKLVLFGFLIYLIPVNAYSQIVPFNSSKWEITADEYKIGNYFGKEGIFIKNGAAIIKDSQFLNGIIEFDIAVSGERGFMGALWRMQDEKNREEFYIRPHQSGKPDANQYTPVFNGNSGWQLYFGTNYSATINYKFNEWMHIKIIISGQQAEVYIFDMENPVLYIPELKHRAQSGKTGVYAGSGFAPAYYANFSYTEIEKPVLKSKMQPINTTPVGTINNWQISNTFSSEWLKDKDEINPNDLKDINWTKLKSEITGITNLARIAAVSQKNNTVFTKLVINSDHDQVKKLKFGYSDNVKVYVNGSLVYGGTNYYRSRDYRYLGTIGLFDEIYPNLHKGENIILFAVTENFGGWGIMAFFENLNGLELPE